MRCCNAPTDIRRGRSADSCHTCETSRVHWIEAHWYKRSAVSLLLWPLSILYRALVALRNLSFRIGLRSQYTSPVPVIVIGNVTVGGTGKTPLVLWTLQWLRANGWRPGAISRGYGAVVGAGPLAVNADSDPCEVGDEPVLLARRSECPVVVSTKRAAAARFIVDHYDCDVIVSDDGLQHLALGRCFEVVVIDGQRRFGNGFCIPAGPLREPLGRLQSIALRVCNGTPEAGEVPMRLVPELLTNVSTGKACSEGELLMLKTAHCEAVAGIGNPSAFFTSLRTLGFTITEHAFTDHHRYTTHDLERVGASRRPIIMTEKDAVKCQRFGYSDCWFLPVTAEPGPQYENALRRHPRLAEPPRPMAGPKAKR